MDITRLSIQKWDWLHPLQPKMDLRKNHYEQNWWRWWNFNWAISNPKRWSYESAALYMPANLENSAVATRLEKVCFHSNLKERQCQRMLKYCTIVLISQASKVMLKILQARLQQYVNCELWDVQTGFRKGRGTRNQIANIHCIIEKAREFHKNIYFCFIDYAKGFDFSTTNWKILQKIGIPDHLTRLLRNLYAAQEETVRTGHGTTDWFQIGKEVHQGCILSLCLFNLYVEYIMRHWAEWNTNWKQDCREKYQ